MTWASKGTLGANGSATDNQATVALTTATTNVAIGEVIVVAIAVDNNAAPPSPDAGDAAVTSVTDSAGNVYTLARNFSSRLAAQAGASISVFYSKATATLNTGGTITATFATAANADATAISAWCYTIASGATVGVAGTSFESTTAADPGSLDVTTANGPHLRFRAIAMEVGTATALTVTAGGWTNINAGGSSASGSTIEIIIRGEWRIVTGTSAASDPSVAAITVDTASVYIAFVEVMALAQTAPKANDDLFPPLNYVTTTAWTPASIPTIAWYDARATTDITIAGGFVTSWADKSGNGKTLTPTSAANLVYGATSLSTLKPGITFDGTNGFTCANLNAGNVKISAFAAAQMNFANITTYGRLVSLAQTGQSDFNGAAAGDIPLLREANSARVSTWGTTPSIDQTTNVAFVTSGMNYSTFAENRVNGTSQTAASYTYGTFTADKLGIGYGVDGVGSPWGGVISEVVVIATDPTATITVAEGTYALYLVIEGYLAWKWGTQASLAVGHPFAAGAPTNVGVASNQTLTPSLFVEADSFLTPTLAAGAVNLAPSLFVEADRFLTPVVLNTNSVTPALFVDVDIFLAPTLTAGAVNLSPSLFAERDVFLTPTVALGSGTTALTPALFSEQDVFLSPSIITTVNLSPNLFAEADAFLTPVVLSNYSVTPALSVDVDRFGVPAITTTRDLTPALFVDQDLFFTHVIVGGSNLTAALFVDADAFNTPALSTSNTISPALFVDTDAFLAPSIATSRDLAPSLFVDADSFRTATVAAGAANLAPALFVDTDLFYAHVILRAGAVVADLFVEPDRFYSATITPGARDLQQTTPVPSDDRFLTHALANVAAIAPSLFVDADTFRTPTITTGAVNLAPSLHVDRDAFNAATLILSTDQDLAPALLVDADGFYNAFILHGIITPLERVMRADAEDRSLSADAENRSLRADAEDRDLQSDTESRSLDS